MGRMCGYVATGAGAPDLRAFFRGCYPAGFAPPPDGVFHEAAPVGLAAGDEPSLAVDRDRQLACAIDGALFDRQALVDHLSALGEDARADTPAELLLRLLARDGREALRRLRGDFALAFWDGRAGELLLARDPYGVKSLYYAETPRGLVFASHLGGLAASPWFERRVGMAGFLEYLACGYISAPYTIYERGAALRPGQLLVLRDGAARVEDYRPIEPEGWAFHDMAGRPEREVVAQLEGLLVDAVQRRLPPGGEVAAYLSGGLDSSLLCALLRRRTDRHVVAYTMGFDNPIHDETPWAREVARHLGVEHERHGISRDEFLGMVPRVHRLYGQPFADISAIPTYVVGTRVAQRFDAVFASDGPDFLFGNFDLRHLYWYYRLMPERWRGPVSAAAQRVVRRFFGRWVSPNLDVPELLRQPDFFWIYPRMFKSADLERLVDEPVYAESFWVHRFLESRSDIPVAERVRLAQYVCYGISSALQKSRGTHDACGVDLVCPYYDVELCDFVNYLPTRYKFRRLYGKYLQKRLLYRHVPRRLLERPKRGFIMDFVEFGVAPIRALTDRYLAPARLREAGYVDADFATRCVEAFYGGDTNMGPKLWTLLMFELWREEAGI